jgi:hypothetical protein
LRQHLPRTVPPLHVRSSHVSQRTAPSAPKQPKISPWSCRAFRDISPGPPPAPSRGVPDARRFRLLQTFGAETQPSVPSAPKASTAQMSCSCTANSHNSSSISVSVKPALQELPRATEAAHEPKPSSWPDVDKLLKAIFPNNAIAKFYLPKPYTYMFYDNKICIMQTYVLMSWIRIDFYGSRLRSWSFLCVTFSY